MNLTGTDLCRVTVVTPRRNLDVGLPADLPIADMLPTLLRVAGGGLADAGLAHGGWVLQRLGEPPFELAATLSDLEVRDGDVLHLRPRGHELPQVAFDDVADAVATGIKERTDRWAPRRTRTFALAAGTALLGVAALALLAAGPPWTLPAIEAAVAAVLLLMGGTALSRAAGDAGAGAVLGFASLPFGFIAGLLLPAPPIPLAGMTAANLLAAFGLTMMLATTAGFAVAKGLPSFLGAAVAAFFGLLGSAVTLFFEVPAAGIAAVLAALAVGLTTVTPSLAFRLAGLPLPALPTNAEELRGEGGDLDGRMVLDRTVVADRFIGGLLGGVALVALGAQALLVTTGTWVTITTSLTLSCALLMRARAFEGRAQRMWLLVSGLAGICLLAVAVAVGAGSTAVLGVVVPGLLVVAVLVVWISLRLVTRKPSPLWGRLTDVADIVLMLALMPLALAVLDVYQAIRAFVS
ncbi:type VII secretion integral membrane protein EccD [Streptosporangium sp. KLBMP 9127]|nr:type VII secretion integral membrane protein EccD [Streptosporangium sp. KLBMP 9127]